MNQDLFTMVGNLVKISDEKKINKIDLYNSILRLIHSSSSWDGEYLKSVIKHLDDWDKEELSTERPEDYIILARAAGEPYLQGIMRLM